LLVALVGGGVGYLFYHNGHEAELHLHKNLTVHLPMAVHILAALALGAGLVLLGGVVRAFLGGVDGWRERRRDKKREAIDRLRQEGRSRLWSGEFESAGRTLEKVVRREPEDVDSVIALAQAHEERGELEKALVVLQSGRARLGADPRLLTFLGRFALRSGNAGAAIEALREAVRTRPGSPFLLSELASALAAEGRFAEAADTARRRLAAEKEPARREEAREALATLSYRGATAMGPSRERDETLKRLMSEDPDFLPPRVLLAGQARARGEVRVAEKLYREGLRRGPRGILLERLASLHVGAGDAQRALGPLRDACSGNRLAGPRLILARTLIAADKLEAAEAELADLARTAPRPDGAGIEPERDLVAGELALARGNDREAARLFARAAAGNHQPFAYACKRCGRVRRDWEDHCRCGAFGNADWLIAAEEISVQPEKAA
jgi:tetratricopeptide (TPR) repeat protein